MIELAAVVVLIIVLVRMSRLERELRDLRRQFLALRRAELPDAPARTATPAAPAASAAGDRSEAADPPLSPAPPLAPPPIRAPAPSVVPPAVAASQPVPARATGPGRHSTAPAVSPADSADAPSGSIERSIGERYLLYAGVIVLVLAVASFLRYAFEHEWLSPTIRVLLGAIGGMGLMAAGRVLAGAGYRPYGLFLSGGGLVMLFLSIYAAFAFYGLIGQAPTFVLLAAVAAGAAMLADREESLPLAVLAVCGGFATPFLVGGREDAQLTLFSYVAALIAATTYLAYRRRWPWLHLVSFALTVFTVAAWAVVHYSDAAYLRTELFLSLYCAMFLASGRASARSSGMAAATSMVLLAAPVLFHLASLALLFPHPMAFLIYMLLVSAAAIAGSVEIDWAPLRAIAWVAVMVPLLVWLETPDGEAWLVGAVAGSVGIWLLFQLAVVWLLARDDRLTGIDGALVHAAGIGVFVALYASLGEPGNSLSIAAVGLALAAANSLIWVFLRSRADALHWLAVATALVATAVTVALDGRWIVVMFASEAAAMGVLGARLDSLFFRTNALVIFVAAFYAWILGGASAGTEPLVPLLNDVALAGVFVVAMLYLTAWAMRGRRSMEDLVWRRQRAAVLVGASLMTVLLVSIDIWNYWADRPAGAIDATLARQLMVSAWWAAYAAALIAAGMRYHYPPVRYFAIALFGATLLKVFAVDLWQLEGGYRVVAFLAVGTILLLASFLYQRMSKVDKVEEAEHR